MRRRSILLSCILCVVLPVAASAAQTRAYVVTTDFVTGGLSVIDLDTRTVAPDVATVHSDAVARWYGGLIWVVNRFGQDNVQVIDPNQGYATIRQFSTGNGSNPQDIAFVSTGKAYVTRYASAGLLIVNPSTGAGIGDVPLGAFADSDGLPEMHRMIRVENRLFVSLQRLTNFAPSNPSQVAVIDTDADTVLDADPAQPGVQAIPLAGRNPTTVFAYDRQSGRLLIGCTGAYGVPDGGVEKINPYTMQSEGFAVTEAELGGDVLDLVWDGEQRSYAIVSDASFNTSLVAWSAVTGKKLGSPLRSTSGFCLSDAELDDRGELYVCDACFAAPGVYVHRASDGATLAGPLATGLPPYQLTFDAATDAAVGVEPRESGLRLAAPFPNPARESAVVELGLPERTPAELAAFDLAGRRMRTLAEGVLPAGPTRVAWDLTDDAGRPVPAGIYFVRLVAAGRAISRRLVLLP